MKILYIWTENYSIFKNNEFNFTDNYHFHFKSESNKLIVEKYPEENNNNTIDRFMKTNMNTVVECISLIVGNNGSGKTSIIKLLFEYFIMKHDLNTIIIIKIGNSINCYCDRMKINIDDLYTMKIPINKKHPYPNFETVYYTNHYNPYHEMGDYHEFHDLSTTNLLAVDNERYYNKSKEEPIKEDQARAHFYLETTRIVGFISDYYSNKIKDRFSLYIPLGLIISINDIDRDLLFNEAKKYKESILIIDKHFKDILNRYILEKSDHQNKDIFMLNLCRSSLYNYLRPHISSSQVIAQEIVLKSIEIINSNLNIENDTVGFVNIFQKLKDIMIKNDIDEEYPYHDNKIQPTINLINIFEKLPKEQFNDSESVNIDLKTDKMLIYKLLNNYFNSYHITHYLKFLFNPAPSSGEFSQLVVFSRIHSLLSSGIDLKKDMIVFIDEIETTLHPSLQRTIMSDLIKYFNVFYKYYKIHLIFASNSPVLLSNVPNGNAIFLKKEDEQCKVVELNEYNTLGSNIHELYWHPFFMHEGLIGKLAEQSIKEAFELLKKNELSNEDEAYLLWFIPKIGEPIIRDALNNKMISKRKRNKQSRD